MVDEDQRKKAYPWLNFIHHSSLTQAIIFTLGFGLVLTNLLIGHSGIAAPYSWTMTENVVYFTMTRITYALGIHMILFVFFTGGFTFGKVFLGRPIFRVLGKLSFESALITPMMVQLIYSQLPNGLFVQFNKVLELGLGNVVCVMVAALGLYLLFEFPFKRIIDFTLLPYVSHDEVLHLHYVRRKLNAPNINILKLSGKQSFLDNDSMIQSEIKFNHLKSPNIHVETVERQQSFGDYHDEGRNGQNLKDSFD